MSRFFATGSDSESDTSSEEEQIQRAPAAAFTFSDDEEDTKRVVRSAKEKRYEEIKNAIKLIGNQKKIKDINPMLNTWEELTKAYNKAAPVIASVENGKTPTFYLRCLVELDDFIKEVWNDTDGRKSMSKTNSKALSTLRQKLRKYIKEKDFEKEIEAFRENPPKDDDDEEEMVEEADSDDEDNDQVNDFKKQEPIPDVAKFKKGAEDDSDSDSDWGSSSDDESSSSSDDDKPHAADYFRKTQKDGGDDEQKQVKKDHRKDRKEKDRKKKREEDDGEGEWETVKGGVAIPSEKPKMFAKDAEINNAAVLKKLNEIIAARGKKRTDRRGQIELLHELQAIAENHNLTAPLVKIKFSIISSIFDYNPKVSDAMKTEYWSKILERIMEMLTLLLSTNDITLSKSIPEDEEEYENAPFKIHGCVLTLVERLDEEFIKLLKECDPHSNEYVERLKDENQVCTIIDKVEEYLERQGVPSELCRIYIRKIEHLYYKCDPTVFKQKEGEIPADASTSVKVMDKMCKYIYSHDETDRLRTRAILSHIYHHAIHDNWFKARDLFLMSHLQDNIHHSDPATQILYNRAVANLGLCAFRHANIKDAHNCLLDLMMTGRVKELLAQGFMPQRQHERNKEQEKIEKQRQMPFHMHINLEVLECVYLVSAMLIEIPYMAAHEFDARKRMISKTYYQQLRSSERQSLVGPPESMREHVVAASKAMRNGNWAACNNFIINEKMNGKVWDLFNQADKVRAMLTKLIKEEALRTYLFTYSHVYDSLSMPTLALMFELERSTVHSIISKMIINEELMASLDEPSETVVMHRSEPSRLQSMALQLTDKVNNFVDSNERIFEMKQGNFRNQGNFRERFNRQDGGGRQRRDRRNDERNKY
ncbi:eukaryotic translation initiation factor 3 subunit C-like [Trichogramma pretiosum]|uniref:eukaryotic translation initiation factor 3 subunit C-like n=1 Tax=Trichogramma pretiosum TaxID=7493 RepID=UPI000C71C1F2|nr:eukaryotic translation initiation factor 3 subunit C-like [Trichogramma pretiosum]XP_023319385.1 eukaryotic translation initiation factor 3 subunit C-like [Trichogramma pretiosum]XP_023319386.1 eukaryotic translation initiation factor 3 subunit C-like [Trichogramma pretiosum]